jgi:hypothetical protein
MRLPLAAALNGIMVCPSDGPVAQLGARMNGIHEVTGSIPVWSTNFPVDSLSSRIFVHGSTPRAALRSVCS